MLKRIARDTVVTCALFSAVAAVWRLGDWRLPAGVMGGGALIGMSFWAIWGGVDAWTSLSRLERGARVGPGAQLVKFFTRHVMLGFAAYGMMVRLHFDPLGLLAGVSSLGVAAGVEAVRGLRGRRLL